MALGDGVKETDCCLLIPATIIAEDVYPDFGGAGYISATTLQKSIEGLTSIRVVSGDHPDMGIVTKGSQVTGEFIEIKFRDNGVPGVVRLFKAKNTPEFLDYIRKSDPAHKDVSIGFYCDVIPEAGEWNGKKYDFSIIDILYDHVAVGIPKGRCTAPNCGLGIHSETLPASFSFRDLLVTGVTDPPRDDEGARNDGGKNLSTANDSTSQTPDPPAKAPGDQNNKTQTRTVATQLTYEQALQRISTLEEEKKTMQKSFDEVKAEHDDLLAFREAEVRNKLKIDLKKLGNYADDELNLMQTDEMQSRLAIHQRGASVPKSIRFSQYAVPGEEEDGVKIQKFDAQKWRR